jgi:type IV secretory pathway TrbD component
MMQRRVNPVFRSLNAPLTIMGAERKLFFFAMMMGAAVFNLLHTFIGGLIMFGLLYWLARWATKTDPQLLRFLLNSAKTRSQYDPMKFAPLRAREMRHV